MLRSLFGVLRFVGIALVVICAVALCVSNRQSVDVTFYPLPYVMSLPLFLLSAVLLIIGLMLGWALAKLSSRRHKRGLKHANRQITALENELSALRAEQSTPALSSR